MSRQVIESQGNNICKSASLAIHCIGKIANHSLAKTSPRVRNKWNWLLIWSSAVQASVQATCEQIASHADVLRGSSRVPALSLRTSAWEASEQTHFCELGKKNWLRCDKYERRIGPFFSRATTKFSLSLHKWTRWCKLINCSSILNIAAATVITEKD